MRPVKIWNGSKHHSWCGKYLMMGLWIWSCFLRTRLSGDLNHTWITSHFLENRYKVVSQDFFTHILQAGTKQSHRPQHSWISASFIPNQTQKSPFCHGFDIIGSLLAVAPLSVNSRRQHLGGWAFEMGGEGSMYIYMTLFIGSDNKI